jgi:hypothetical protein
MSNIDNIIYISGSGRSGSTLLERVLHSSRGVIALGEFHCLWRLPHDQITCSCATTFADDGFWKSVLDHAGIDQHSIAALRALEGRVCRTSFIAKMGFSLPALAANSDVQQFLDFQFRIFESVAAISGSATLVDSSKAGPRAWLLSCDPRVRILHLYRDPADVIASWRSIKFDTGMGREMKRMSIAGASNDWWKVEQLIRILGRKRPVARLNYEAMCASPQQRIADSIAQLGLTQPVQADWIDAKSVRQGVDYHSLNGNPDRFASGPISISHRTPAWATMASTERMAIKTTGLAIRTFYPF